MSLPCSYFLKSSLISANPPFLKLGGAAAAATAAAAAAAS